MDEAEHLPYHASITPFNAVVAYQHLKGSAGCIICHARLGEDSYLIKIPAQTREGVPYKGTGAEVCSLAHARAWLDAYVPQIRTEEQYPTQGLPTQATGAWLYAFRLMGTYPLHTVRSGKWLVLLSAATVDRYWQKIKQAVEQGKLGDSAKVTTGACAPQRAGKPYVICVYTYDHEDLADVNRIRQGLRDLGLVRPITYKSDEDTGFLRYGAHSTPLYRE